MNFFIFLFIYFELLDFTKSLNLNVVCPKILHKVFDDYAPIGNNKAGNYTAYENANTLWPCVAECCKLRNNCNVVFIYNETCYHVKCANDDLCLPLKRTNITVKLQMVLINPVSNEDSWMDILKDNYIDITIDDNNSDNSYNNQQHSDQTYNLNKYDLIDVDDGDDNNNIYGIPLTEKLSSSTPLNMVPSSTLLHDQKLNDIYLDRNTLYNTGKFSSSVSNNRYDNLNNMNNIDDINDLQMDESKYHETYLITCDVGDVETSCPKNEKCIQLSPKSLQGVCDCKPEYIRNENNVCSKMDLDINPVTIAEKLLLKQINSNSNSSEIVEDILNVDNINSFIDKKNNDMSSAADSSIQSSTSVQQIKNLTVSVISKNVRLPETEVTLSAYTIPDEKSTGDHYKYLWTLISQPSGDINGTMSDQTKENIKLTNLSEGLYTFKVNVTGNGLYGETYANVSVLPAKRINKPPEVIITPNEQTVKLPRSNAILDGSTSKDDDQIIAWHWDLIQGPIGYQPVLPETSTLQLTDLTSPGNYTFKLTVTDSDMAKNSTTAFINVTKAIDYPPEANAGSDVIIYLPHNNVTLNGSLSTDDHEITSWEWTKDTSDDTKAVDMQNTRTPYLELSNLEEGIYTFILKVLDASGQSTSSKVHVFVKPPTNSPPHANAGQNQTINLPQNWILLNGTQSFDDIKISKFFWTQLSGPLPANILNGNESITNVTGLTIGTYVFQLIVSDENNNNDTSKVWITIVQEKNSPPIANAGGDQTVTLPVNTIYLNGSNSKDDLGIVNYTWTRDSSSLAFGTIVGDTDRQSVLILTNVVYGRYVFKLTVTDAQGLSNSDTVSIIVRQDPYLMNLVELTFTIGVSVLTQAEFETLEQKLILLLGDNTKLHVRDLRIEQKTGEAVLVFYVEKMTSDGHSQIMLGLDVEKLLIDKFWKDSAILGTSISDIRTTYCQNTCSGHGICNTATRACMCETFWMPDIFYFWGIGQANCDWSILYVVIGVFITFLFISGICWGLTCLCRKTHKPRTRTKPQKYALLGTQDEENLPSFTRPASISESDTDSDVLFESKTKQNGILRSNKTQKYSVTRLGRRIKT